MSPKIDLNTINSLFLPAQQEVQQEKSSVNQAKIEVLQNIIQISVQLLLNVDPQQRENQKEWALDCIQKRQESTADLEDESFVTRIKALETAIERLRWTDQTKQPVQMDVDAKIEEIKKNIRNLGGVNIIDMLKAEVAQMNVDLKIRESVLEAVKKNGLILMLATDFQDDKEIVQAAVRQEGCALIFADEKLQDDEDIAFDAVRNAGAAIKFVSDRLKKNPELFAAAIRRSNLALLFYRDEMREKTECIQLEEAEEFQIALVEQGWYEFVNPKYVKYEKDPSIMEDSGPKWKRNKKLALAAVKHMQHHLEELPFWQNDKEIVMEAVQHYPGLLASPTIPLSLKKDQDVWLASLTINGKAITKCLKNLEKMDDVNDEKRKRFILEAVRRNGHVLKHLDPNLYKAFKEDPDLISAAEKQIKEGPFPCRHIKAVNLESFRKKLSDHEIKNYRPWQQS